MSTTLRHHNFQNVQCPFLPTGSYFITNVRHGVSVALPPHQDELCGSQSDFKWKIINDSDNTWYIQGGAGPWFAHRRPAPQAGNPIIASQEQFGWVIGQCHAIKDPDCYLIYANSDHTLLWGLEDGENETPVTFCTGENNRRNWWRFKRIPDDGEDQIGVKPSLTLPTHDPQPRYIIIIGATGSGKSSFINDATGLELPVRHDLDSCTKRIQATDMLLDGRPVVLLDTPGFGHSDLSDPEVLRLIGDYLANLYRNGIKLTGLVYMQRISDPRIDSQAQRYFGIFEGICGHSNLDHTVVVTTRWNEIDARLGHAREKELMSGVFKPVLATRGKVVRHDRTVDSAKDILRHALKKDAKVVRIQSQLIDHDIDLLATEAGLKLSKNAEVVRPRGFKRWLRRLWG